MTRQVCEHCKMQKSFTDFINPRNNNELKFCFECTKNNWCKHQKNKLYCKQCSGEYQVAKIYYSIR